jgi:hypothetical protein
MGRREVGAALRLTQTEVRLAKARTNAAAIGAAAANYQNPTTVRSLERAAQRYEGLALEIEGGAN